MKKVLKTLICILSCILVLFVSTPFAFADDNPVEVNFKTFNFPFEKPLADDSHSYAEIVYSRYDSSTGTYTYLPYLLIFSVHNFPVADENLRTSLYVDNGQSSVNDPFFSFQSNSLLYSDFDLFVTCYDLTLLSYKTIFRDTYSYDVIEFNFSDVIGSLPSGFNLHSVNIYGGNVHNATVLLFNDCIFNYGSEVNTFELLTNIYESIQNLSFATGSGGLDSEQYAEFMQAFQNLQEQAEYISDDTLTLRNDVASIENYINTLKSTVNLIYSKISTLVVDNKSILASVTSLESNLKSVLRYAEYLSSISSEVKVIYNTLYYLYTSVVSIDNKLDRILEILEGQTGVTVSVPDKSSLNEYYSEENDLLQPPSNPEDAFHTIEFNQNAFSFIWNTADRFLHINPKIFTTLLVLLSFGLVALILGRKVN